MSETPRETRVTNVVRVICSSLGLNVGGVTVVETKGSALVVRYQNNLYQLTVAEQTLVGRASNPQGRS